MENVEFRIEGNQSKINSQKIRPRLKITYVEQSFFLNRTMILSSLLRISYDAYNT